MICCQMPDLAQITMACAAIRLADGTIYSVPRPGRHHDVIRVIREAGITTPIRQDQQGFLLSDGRWAKRMPALMVALKAGQIKEPLPPHSCHGLFSEDVW
jgi:hypothetical protein